MKRLTMLVYTKSKLTTNQRAMFQDNMYKGKYKLNIVQYLRVWVTVSLGAGGGNFPRGAIVLEPQQILKYQQFSVFCKETGNYVFLMQSMVVHLLQK